MSNHEQLGGTHAGDEDSPGAERPDIDLTVDPLVSFYNEMAQELNGDKDRAERMRLLLSPEDLASNPTVSFALGRIKGFDHFMQALQAHIVTRGIDDVSMLIADQDKPKE